MRNIFVSPEDTESLAPKFEPDFFEAEIKMEPSGDADPNNLSEQLLIKVDPHPAATNKKPKPGTTGSADHFSIY